MKQTIALALILTTMLSGCSTAQATTATQQRNYPQALVNYDDFKNLVKEVEGHRNQRLVSFDEFLKMSKEKNTIILDTRSDFRYNRKHLKGATHLSFTDFTEENLRKLIPDPNTKILIYCNNNFKGDLIDFASKVKRPNSDGPEIEITLHQKPIMLALNIPTYINLYGYGYKNVYELDELVSVKDERVVFEGTEVQKNTSFHHPPHYFGKMSFTTQKIEALNKRIEENAQDSNLYLDRALAYKNLIFEQMASSNFEDYRYTGEWETQAYKDLNIIIAAQPHNAQALFERATLLGNSQNVQNNINDLGKAITLDQTKSDYYFYRGLNYSELHKHDLALKDYNEALKIETNKQKQIFIIESRARSYGELGEYAKAIHDYDEVIKAMPLYETAREERQRIVEKMK
jgi:tetratricopeptide (TPR) repeat protein